MATMNLSHNNESTLNKKVQNMEKQKQKISDVCHNKSKFLSKE